MNTLLIVSFETGDSSCRYWEEIRLIDSTKFNYNEFIDCFMSFLETEEADTLVYDEIVNVILDSLGWEFHPFIFPTTINDFKIIYV